MDFTSHIYPPDSILREVHLVVPPGYPDWKLLKLRDLEFANRISPTEGSPIFRIFNYELRTGTDEEIESLMGQLTRLTPESDVLDQTTFLNTKATTIVNPIA